MEGALIKHDKVKHQGLKEFICKQCNYSTGHKPHLTQHVKAIHEKLKEFRCEDCDHVTTQISHLTQHKIVKHGRVSKTFDCASCDYKGISNGYLLKHIEFVHLE